MKQAKQIAMGSRRHVRRTTEHPRWVLIDTKGQWTLASYGNETAQEVIALLLAEFQRSGLTLRTRFAEDVPRVYGDRIQLQQVILNLLLNASDAMKGVTDRSREVLLRTHLQHDGDVRLTVVDAGGGIPPEHADRIFEPFSTTKSAGMGIGLSVCRSLIERHHGRLWAEPNERYATSFSFSIPPHAE